MKSTTAYHRPDKPPLMWACGEGPWDWFKPLWIPYHERHGAWYWLHGSPSGEDHDDLLRRHWFTMPKLPAKSPQWVSGIDKQWTYPQRVLALQALTAHDLQPKRQSWSVMAGSLNLKRDTYRSRVRSAQARLNSFGVLPWAAWDEGAVPEGWWKDEQFFEQLDRWCQYAPTASGSPTYGFGWGKGSSP